MYKNGVTYISPLHGWNIADTAYTQINVIYTYYQKHVNPIPHVSVLQNALSPSKVETKPHKFCKIYSQRIHP